MARKTQYFGLRNKVVKDFDVKLNLNDLTLLYEQIDNELLRTKLKGFISGFGDSFYPKIFQFTDNEIDLITDSLSDLFCQKGLDKDDEPNSFGIYIENLIDDFTRETN